MSEKMMKAIIVDDAARARKLLRLMLVDLAPDMTISGEAANVAEAVVLIERENPDVVFLDIEMPGKTGLQLVEEISRNEVPYEIIFTTAYNEYALRAFRLSAIDYLLKPIDEKQLIEAIEKIRKIKSIQKSELRLQNMVQNLKYDVESTVTIPALHGYIFLKIAEIIYIKADGSYTEIVCVSHKSITVSRNLKYFEQTLEGFSQFVRVHRSFLINVNHIQRFDKSDRGVIVMQDGTVIDLARERRDSFFKALPK
jgi:two-component system LytT family response regulator